MKKIFLFACLAALLTACGGASVKVTNTRNLDRTNETVEIAWSDVVAKVKDATPENILVIAPGGAQQPSQVIYNGTSTPQALIFQATVPAKKSATYQLKTGTRENYTEQAYGRFVPERMDDYAWENNRIAFRMYGPALEATGEISNGIDAWIKSTENMIINKWYTPGYDYHRDQGEGLDCYKVGRTLGAGAMAPYEKDSLWLGNNFISYKTLDNGPIRTSFQLDYAPYRVDTFMVTETRIISLDANTHFNRITEKYSGDFDRMKVAAGVVLRGPGGKVLDILEKPISMVGYWEPLNTDNKPDNGHTCLGLVFPGEITVETRLGHLLASTSVKNGEELTYLSGTGWSKGFVESSAAWTQEIFDQSVKFNHPLQVTLK